MGPCGLFTAKNPLFQVPMIWALHRLGLPYNRITTRAEIFFSKEELMEKIEEATPRSIIFWDEAQFNLHKPTVWETWALLAWWDFQRWAF